MGVDHISLPLGPGGDVVGITTKHESRKNKLSRVINITITFRLITSLIKGHDINLSALKLIFPLELKSHEQ